MSQQFHAKSGESIQLLDFLNYWISTKRTLEEKLDKGGLDIFSAQLIVQGTYNGSIVSMILDGTSKSVYRGTAQYATAGKPMITDILEIQSKRENIIGLEEEKKALWGNVSNNTFLVRTIGKLGSALTCSAVPGKALTVTLESVGENFSVYLELLKPQSE